MAKPITIEELDALHASEQTPLEPEGGQRPITMEELDAANTTPEPKVRTNLRTAIETKPDSVAEAGELSRKQKIPKPVVERNMDQIRKRETVDFLENLSKNYPALRKKFGDPDFAKVAHDDAEALSSLEDVFQKYGFRTASEVGRRMADAPKTVPHGVVQSELRPEATIPNILRARADALFQGFTKGRAGLESQIASVLDFPELAREAHLRREDVDREIQLTQPLIQNKTAAGVVAGVDSFLHNAPGMALAVLTRNPVPALALAGLNVETEAFGRFKQRGASDGEALIGAMGEAGIEIGTELLPMKFLVDSFGKVGFSKFMTGMLLREVPAEQIATLTQDAIDTAIANPDKTWSEYLAERPEAAYTTLLATITQTSTVGAIGAGVRMLPKTKKAIEAEAAGEVLQKMMQLVQASALAQRDSSSFESFLQEASKDGPLENLYIDGETFAQSMTDANITMEQLAEAAPEVAAQLQESAAAGTTVRIPTAQFGAQLANTDLGEALLPHLKVDPNGMSQDEAQTFMQSAAEELKSETEKILKEEEEGSELVESSERVKQHFETQLKEAGRFTNDVNQSYATLLSSFYTTVGSRLGVTPEEMLKRYPLLVQSQAARGEVELDQPGTEAFDRFFGDSKVVDESGAPLVVYHGSPVKGIETFVGDIFLSDNIEVAEGYTSRRGLWRGQPTGEVTQAYVALQNPLVIDALGKRNDNIPVPWQEWRPKVFGNLPPDAANMDAVVARAKEQGHDGVIVRNLVDTATVDGKNKSTVVVAFRSEQVKSATQNRGTFDPSDPNTLNQPVSTRLPTAVRATEDPLGEKILVIDLAAMKTDPKKFKHNVSIVTKYPNYQPNPQARTPNQRAEAFIQHAIDNLLWLHDQVPDDIRQRSKLWYDGANKLAQEWAERFGVTPSQVAGVIASLSPQKDWFMNVSLAERVLDIVTTKYEADWTNEMTATMDRIFGDAKYAKLRDKIRGRKFADLAEAGAARAAWVRIYDQTFNTKDYRIATPEGAFADVARNDDGSPSGLAWGSLGEIAKAVSVVADGSRENISRRLGGQHKVRNFYNNIIDPNGTRGDITIDTHAVAAALLRPLSSSKKPGGAGREVNHAFGSNIKGEVGPSSSTLTGVMGTYGLYAEAYRRAAEQRGILPREMQSITWEAIRGLYPETFKNAANSEKIDGIWKEYRSKRATAEQVRERLLAEAGGINPPDWVGSDSGGAAAAGTAADSGELSGPGVPGGSAEPDSTGGASRARRAARLSRSPARFAQSGRGGVQQGGQSRSPSLAEAHAAADSAARGERRLEGAPTKPLGIAGQLYIPGPAAVARGAARDYMEQAELVYNELRTYKNVSPARAKRIAAAYDKMKHAPNDAEVKAAYAAMIEETLAQYETILETGLQVEFIKGPNPYAETPRQAILDVVENNHLFVYSTKSGFGSDATFDPSENPLLAPTKFKDINGTPMLANDVFRVVHDYFGHIKDGNGFRADGEENAWRSHAKMYSPLARRAMTSETRGQNSWVNYGPHGATNRTASSDDTIFADQKTGLLPEWVSEEALEDDTLQQENRGQITFASDITQQPTVISLLNAADLSTFLHESGHFFLEVMTDIASQPDAPQQVIDDLNTFFNQVGVKDLAEWQSMDLEQRRPRHEVFARSFEAYLFTGRAPNQELQGLFARFRAWMINVYKQLTELRVDLNEGITGIFDRLIATDEQIATAERERGMLEDVFGSAEEAGMTPQQWEAYQEDRRRATQTAMDELQGRSLRDMKWLRNARARELRKLRREVKEKLKATREEVAAEVRARPLYAAIRFLTRGEVPSHLPEDTEPAKLSIEAMRAIYGDGPAAPWRYLNTGKYGHLTKEDGLHPNTVAELFGLTSGDHLVREILESPPEQEVIEAETQRRLLERYGDLTTREGLERAADEAVHNDARAKVIATELNALRKALGQRQILAKAAKAYAEAIIARRRLRDVKPGQHTSAASRAAKEAEKAKELAEKVRAKQIQLVQHNAARAASDALEEIRKGRAYLQKFSNSNIRDKVDPDYLDQIDRLLDRFDFRRYSPKAEQRRVGLKDWMENQRELGFDPVIAPALEDEANRKHYTDMTVEEFRGLIDAVRNIEHLGRLKTKLLKLADQRRIEEILDELVANVEANATKVVPEQRSSLAEETKLVRAGQIFRGFLAEHRKFASIVRQIDGLKEGGPMWEYFSRGMNASGDFEASENEKATVALTQLMQMLDDGPPLRQKAFIESLGKSLTRERRISIALNMGNAINRERVMTGEGMSPAQLTDVLQTLSNTELEFVQKIWDLINSYWPQIAAKQKRVTGTEPEKVESELAPELLEVAGKRGVKLTGGYYPIQYDPNLDERSHQDINNEVLRQIQQGLYVNAQTRRGHTKARAESTGRRLRLDFGAIPMHITQVIHDLAWHEYLVDANRLLRDKRLTAAIKQHYGVELYRTMVDTLKDIAMGGLDIQRWHENILNGWRHGATVVGLGLRFSTAALQPLGFTQSIVRIGPKWVLKGLKHWYGNASKFESSIKDIYARSDFMRLRGKTMQREINEIRNKVRGEDSRLEASYFYMILKMQLVVDVPTWYGAYEKAMQHAPDETRAIALADQAVRDSQASGQIADLAAVQRGSPAWKLFTNFYSYFSATYNLTVERVSQTNFRKPGDIALLATDLALLYTIPALLGTLLQAALSGDDEWDWDEIGREVIADQISYALAPIMLLRELAGVGRLAVGLPGDYTGPAGLRLVSSVYRLSKQAAQGDVDEAFLRAANQVAGILFKYPAGQLENTVEGIVALAEGESQDPRVLLSGAPR